MKGNGWTAMEGRGMTLTVLLIGFSAVEVEEVEVAEEEVERVFEA